jgi:hypothetical protein
MNMQPIVTHLKAHTSFRQIGGAADMAAVEDSPVLDPACFVVPLDDQRDEDSEDVDGGFGRQVRFGVLYVVANRRDPRGAAAQDELHTARTAGDVALATLTPTGAQSPARWLRGRLVKFAQGQVWWMDEFETFLIA